jgi:hypothetical protein
MGREGRVPAVGEMRLAGWANLWVGEMGAYALMGRAAWRKFRLLQPPPRSTGSEARWDTRVRVIGGHVRPS